MEVRIVVFDGFDELDAIGPFEVMKNAAACGADIQVELVTAAPVREVTAAHGLRIRPSGILSGKDRLDVLVVPGGNWNNRAPQGIGLK